MTHVTNLGISPGRKLGLSGEPQARKTIDGPSAAALPPRRGGSAATEAERGYAVGRTGRPDGAQSRAQSPIADPEVLDLLENVRSVRRAIDTDLTIAAAALDADRPDVAHDIIDGALADVAAFRAAAIERLNAEAAETEPAPSVPTQPGPRWFASRRARALVAIPTIPLVGALAMGAAAAIGDLGTPTHHVHHAAGAAKAIAKPATRPSATPTAASTTLARLERVVAHHPESSQVLAVADDLHKQLTHIITTASHNPNQLDVVSQLLTVEQRVLTTNHAPGASLALAAARQVRTLLQQTTTPIMSLTNPIPSSAPHSTNAPSTTSTTSKKSHHATKKTSKHHKQSTHQKHVTHTPPAIPTPSNPLFGIGVFGALS